MACPESWSKPNNKTSGKSLAAQSWLRNPLLSPNCEKCECKKSGAKTAWETSNALWPQMCCNGRKLWSCCCLILITFLFFSSVFLNNTVLVTTTWIPLNVEPWKWHYFWNTTVFLNCSLILISGADPTNWQSTWWRWFFSRRSHNFVQINVYMYKQVAFDWLLPRTHDNTYTTNTTEMLKKAKQ